jgi:hypothetical protein
LKGCSLLDSPGQPAHRIVIGFQQIGDRWLISFQGDE